MTTPELNSHTSSGLARGALLWRLHSSGEKLNHLAPSVVPMLVQDYSDDGLNLPQSPLFAVLGLGQLLGSPLPPDAETDAATLQIRKSRQ